MQTSGNSSSDANTMTMSANATTSSMSNITATMVDAAAYQSAQYLANNTILRLFNDTLKPLTLSSNETSADNNNATMTTQEAQNSSTIQVGNMASDIDKLEAGLLQLKDDINGKATSNEVMTTAHVNIHPVLMQIYGLVIEEEH
jgi:tryptophan 2,3-dioxygenase